MATDPCINFIPNLNPNFPRPSPDILNLFNLIKAGAFLNPLSLNFINVRGQIDTCTASIQALRIATDAFGITPPAGFGGSQFDLGLIAGNLLATENSIIELGKCVDQFSIHTDKISGASVGPGGQGPDLFSAVNVGVAILNAEQQFGIPPSGNPISGMLSSINEGPGFIDSIGTNLVGICDTLINLDIIGKILLGTATSTLLGLLNGLNTTNLVLALAQSVLDKIGVDLNAFTSAIETLRKVNLTLQLPTLRADPYVFCRLNDGIAGVGTTAFKTAFNDLSTNIADAFV